MVFRKESNRDQLVTLSRLLPLIMAVGKHLAAFLTAARICEAAIGNYGRQCINSDAIDLVKREKFLQIQS